ncbi:MAG: hypothetical protein IH840_14610 [Candidatus Heimdallarchaeota archaeon]|nr:hypothetical protein [Candidatus Heimdallarchaeota archaeon]
MVWLNFLMTSLMFPLGIKKYDFDVRDEGWIMASNMRKRYRTIAIKIPGQVWIVIDRSWVDYLLKYYCYIH